MFSCLSASAWKLPAAMATMALWCVKASRTGDETMWAPR